MIQKLKKYNSSLILLSLALSIVLGICVPNLFQSIKFLGDLFINLLKLFALPLICSALIACLGNMSGGLDHLKSLSKRIISYMLVSEIAAVTIALILFNLFRPGVGGRPELILNGQSYDSTAHHGLDFTQFVLSIFPENIFWVL